MQTQSTQRTRRTALGVITTAPAGRRRRTATATADRPSHVRMLLAIATILAATTIAFEITDRRVSSLPLELTSYEQYQLEEVRYLLWADGLTRPTRAGS